MQGNDLSNEISPVLIVIFEGLIGLLPEAKDRLRYDRAMNRGRYREAAEAFHINRRMVDAIWDVVWNKAHRVEAVTFLPAELTNHLFTRMELHDIPIGRLEVARDTHHFSRELNYRPWVAAIYDADPAHRFLWGGRGRITSPHQPNLLGI